MTTKLKYILTFSLLVSISIGVTSISRAQSPSPDSQATTSSAIDNDTIKQNIQDRIKKAITQSDSDIIGQTSIGWTGTITSLTNQSITIEADNISKQIALTDSTTLIKNSKPITLEDIEIDTPILAIGKIDTNNILVADQIESIESLPTRSQKQSELATVNNIDTKTKTFTLTKLSSSQDIIITYTKITDFLEIQNNQITDLDFDVIIPGDTILIIYEPDAKIEDQNNALIFTRTKSAPITNPTPSSTPAL